MHNLINTDSLSYDSMNIIYYCFNMENHKIIEFTEKAHLLTEFLIKNKTKIVVPSFLISEIKRKDTMEMINTFIFSKQITNMPHGSVKNLTDGFLFFSQNISFCPV